ncbi:protein translocase subunit SECA2, chloroplastic isoform X1 [Senna tora]|uniref:Protein translocase subunit SECA2, chloroplastic isoform X1 n=1 Tax=Senna tora TaxID=362788 RepID=A0A834T673_9FABA|nr:protein translocase subunit SECA2, chloroplastic isoform X1 [Senna tora]
MAGDETRTIIVAGNYRIKNFLRGNRRASVTFAKMIVFANNLDKLFLSYKWRRWSFTLWNPVGSFCLKEGCDSVVQRYQYCPGMQLELLGLQINAEKYFFGIRKNLVEFDEVLEVQLKHVYDLRQLILTGDDESCSQHIFQYMQAVVDEIVIGNVDPQKHPDSWVLSKLIKEFVAIGGKLLHRITNVTLLKSLGQLYDVGSMDIVNFSLPNLPAPPNTFRRIRKKSSSLRRWLAICSDDLIKDGNYRTVTNLHGKYLGDFLIA